LTVAKCGLSVNTPGPKGLGYSVNGLGFRGAGNGFIVYGVVEYSYFGVKVVKGFECRVKSESFAF